MCKKTETAASKAARFAAMQQQAIKEAKFGSDNLKYWNRETTYKRGKEASATGFSRAKSDIYVRALDIAAQGRVAAESAHKEYAMKRYADEGGRSIRAGRNQLVALLQKTSQIDRANDNAFGRNMDQAYQGALRTYNSNQLKNRARLGVRPEWGAPVMMPAMQTEGGFLDALQKGLSIATDVAGLATGIGPAMKGLKGLKKIGGFFKAAKTVTQDPLTSIMQSGYVDNDRYSTPGYP